MDFTIRRLGICDSTNRVLAAAAAEGADAGTVIVADEQTGGRGRRGRSWHAPPGTSLLCSILLRPALPPASRGVLPLAIGVAVHRTALAHAPQADAWLKWPNDLLLDGAKAAGMLLEGVGDAVIVGVGLNLDWRDVVRPVGLTATSLAEHGATAVARDAVLDTLLGVVAEEVRLAESDPDGAVRRYLPRCTTLGSRVRVLPAGRGEALIGEAVSLTPEGHLRVRDDAGRTHVLQAGDVEHVR